MITGDDFLSLAGKLIANPAANEGTCRTSISRAYYAVFHLSSELLADLGFRVGHNHGEVHRHLCEAKVVAARSAGELLKELHSNRVRADYRLNLDKPGQIDFAKENVELASTIRSLLQECLQEPTRSELKTTLEEYSRRISPRK